MLAETFLYPFRKRVEMLAALYAGGFGMFIWLMVAMGVTSPIYWHSSDVSAQMYLAQILVVAAFLHSVGIRVNGKWKYSPAVRLAGMSLHSLVFGSLVVSGWGTSAGYTYAWVTAAMMWGAVSAARDLAIATGWRDRWQMN